MTGVGLARKAGEAWGSLRGEVLSAGLQHGGRVLRFGSVGLVGVGVNYLVLYLLAGVSGINHVLAAVFATETAILSNFALNHRWTFKDRRSKASLWKLAARYNFFTLGGLGISVAVLAGLTYLLGLGYLFANLFAIGAATLWNYAANNRWTWSVRTVNPALDAAETPEDNND